MFVNEFGCKSVTLWKGLNLILNRWIQFWSKMWFPLTLMGHPKMFIDKNFVYRFWKWNYYCYSNVHRCHECCRVRNNFLLLHLVKFSYKCSKIRICSLITFVIVWLHPRSRIIMFMSNKNLSLVSDKTFQNALTFIKNSINEAH